MIQQRSQKTHPPSSLSTEVKRRVTQRLKRRKERWDQPARLSEKQAPQVRFKCRLKYGFTYKTTLSLVYVKVQFLD